MRRFPLGQTVFVAPLTRQFLQRRLPNALKFGGVPTCVRSPVDNVGYESAKLESGERGNMKIHFLHEVCAINLIQCIQVEVIPERLREAVVTVAVAHTQLRARSSDGL